MRESDKQLSASLQRAYEWADRRTNGTLGTLRAAIIGYDQSWAAEAAASMAYYAFFSLFPLLMLLVGIASLFLQSEQVVEQVAAYAYEVLPLSGDLIIHNLQRIQQVGGLAGIAGLIGLTWAASGFFTVLVRHVNQAWPNAVVRGPWQRRWLGLRMVGIALGLLLFTFIPSAGAELLAGLDIPFGGSNSIYDTTLWRLLSDLIPGLLAFLFFVALYRWIPNTMVRWREAAGGALPAAVAWQAGSSAFGWYLGSGLARFELVYGSLGTVVALLFWIYLSNAIILMGAHLSAAIARRAQPARPSQMD